MTTPDDAPPEGGRERSGREASGPGKADSPAGGPGRRPPPTEEEWSDEEVTLVELVNRTIDRGVVLHGAATLSVADVDLVDLTLDLFLKGVGFLREPAGPDRTRRPDETDRSGGA